MTNYSIERTVNPVNEPLTKEAAKRQCLVELSETAFDVWFEGEGSEKGAIAAARELVESDTNSVLMPATFVLKASDWNDLLVAGFIDLQRHPVRSISAVGYYDSAGTLQSLNPTLLEVNRSKFRSDCRRVSSATSLPSTDPNRSYPLSLTLLGGYSLSTDDVKAQRAAVPRAATMAIQLLLGHWFRNRESVAVGTISSEIAQSYLALVRSLKQERYR